MTTHILFIVIPCCVALQPTVLSLFPGPQFDNPTISNNVSQWTRSFLYTILAGYSQGRSAARFVAVSRSFFWTLNSNRFDCWPVDFFPQITLDTKLNIVVKKKNHPPVAGTCHVTSRRDSPHEQRSAPSGVERGKAEAGRHLRKLQVSCWEAGGVYPWISPMADVVRL